MHVFLTRAVRISYTGMAKIKQCNSRKRIAKAAK
jgi:hypothetical protein